MKERVSLKNVIGGFIGGVFGILIFGYFGNNFYLSGLGVFVAVLIGTCYEAIFAFFVEVWEKVRKWKAGIGNWFHILTGRIQNIRQWVNASDENRTQIYEAISYIIFCFSTVFFCIKLSFPVIKFLNGYVVKKPFQAFAFSIFLAFFPVVLCEIIKYFDKKRIFENSLKRYQKYGAIKFIGIEIVLILRIVIVSFLLLWIGIFYFCTSGILFFLVFALPVLAFMAGMKAIYSAVVSVDFWVCFIVTISITFLTAWFCAPLFKNYIVLWLAALLNGVICGAFSEAVRCGTAWCFCNTKTGKFFAEVSVSAYWKKQILSKINIISLGWKKINLKRFVLVD